MSVSTGAAAAVAAPPTPLRVGGSGSPVGGFPIIRVAVWFGLATGILELLFLGYRRYVAGQAVWVSGQVIWMAPLAYVLLFLACAAPIAVLARTRWRALVPAAAMAGFTFVLVASPLLIFGLHRAAIAVLAAGAAVQAARVVRSRPERLLRPVRATVVWLLALVAVVALVVNGSWWLAERRALAALPAATEGAPNIILLILDTVRAKSLGLYGSARATSPELDRLARRGVVFENAIAPAPWTLPTHASVFTGRWAHELSADWESPLDRSDPTLAEVLREHGYVTGGFVANIPYTSRIHGLARGFIRYEDYPVSAAQVVLSASLGRAVTNSGPFRRLIRNQDILNRKRAPRMNRDVLDWIEEAGDRPFFAFVNYYDAHEPYIPQPPWAGSFGPQNDFEMRHFTIDAWLHGREKLGADEIARERNAYEASIAGLDHGIGALVDELELRGLMENTILIVAGDHGEQFGEHGLTNHGNSLYLPLLRVPLLITGRARVPAGGRVHEIISLRDVPATILELAGAAPALPGRSLAHTWRAGTQRAATQPIFASVTSYDPGPTTPLAAGDMASVIDQPYQLIRNGNGGVELYDILADPEQRHDLSGSPAHRSIRLELERLLGTVTTRDSRRPGSVPR